MFPRLLLSLLFYIPHYCYSWGWKDAQNQLFHGNIEILESLDNTQKASFNYSNIRSLQYPNLYFRIGAERFLQEDASLGFRGFIGPRLSWTLYQGGKIRNQKKSSLENHSVSENALKLTKLKQIHELRSAFAKALYAKNYLSQNESILRRSRRNLRLVSLRYKSGQEFRYDYLGAKNTISQYEVNVMQAKTNQRSSLSRLREILGDIPIQSLDKLSKDGFYEEEFIFPIDINQLVLHHPEKLQAEKEARQSFFNTKVVRSAQLPTISFRTDFILIDTDDEPIIPFWYAGINFSVPILEGGRNRRNYSSSKQTYEIMRKKQHQVATRLKERILTELDQYRIQLRRVDLQKAHLIATQEKAIATNDRYKMGLVKFNLWNRAYTNLSKTEINLLKAKRDLYIQRANVERAMGVISQ